MARSPGWKDERKRLEAREGRKGRGEKGRILCLYIYYCQAVISSKNLYVCMLLMEAKRS